AQRSKRAAAAAYAANSDPCVTPATKRPKGDNLLQKAIECPLCDEPYYFVSGLVVHLKYGHKTTPKEAGVVFRCECGKESVSNSHSHVNPCGLARTTVLIKVQDSIIYKTESAEQACEEGKSPAHVNDEEKEGAAAAAA
ncbi:hypothetical protein PFISCL1PPCAC_3023, partial [Pristionchus fissidentatus]